MSQFSNRFKVLRTDHVTRIDFCEVCEDQSINIASIVLGNDDADQLAALIQKLVTEHVLKKEKP